MGAHGGHGFIEGFLKSWGVILASEIGDKTFFIAAIMAMRHARLTVRRRRRRRRLAAGAPPNPAPAPAACRCCAPAHPARRLLPRRCLPARWRPWRP